MDKDKGEPVISVKTEDKKEEKKPEGEKVEEKDKKPEGEKTEGAAAEETKTEGLLCTHIDHCSFYQVGWSTSLRMNLLIIRKFHDREKLHI